MFQLLIELDYLYETQNHQTAMIAGKIGTDSQFHLLKAGGIFCI